MRRDRVIDVEEVVGHFDLSGAYRNSYHHGEGYINDTYLVEMIDGKSSNFYILQRINNDLFTDVDALMENIDLVTSYARKTIIKRGGDPLKETLTVIKAKDGKPYYFDGEDHFRIFVFIPNSFAYQKVNCPEDFYKSAVSFGDFSSLLDGFDATKLHEIIPHFHDTENRLEKFKKAIEADKYDRVRKVQNEIKFVLDHSYLCDKITSKLGKEIPLRVTHNDAKLNNILFDKDTLKPLAIVDLDTVMPGCLAYDFGDSIRFGCNSAAEDEEDLSKVHFALDLFDIYAKGYLESVNSFTSYEEKHSLVWGAIVITFECGMRFLTDYLKGDTYFKTTRPKQNLYRCRTQFKLVEEMLENFDTLNDIIDKYSH